MWGAPGRGGGVIRRAKQAVKARESSSEAHRPGYTGKDQCREVPAASAGPDEDLLLQHDDLKVHLHVQRFRSERALQHASWQEGSLEAFSLSFPFRESL